MKRKLLNIAKVLLGILILLVVGYFLFTCSAV